jgi:UDP-N-acetylmuramoyl-L-alanyl-D-glutamate--2,6-diaminopimelate ligase
LRFGDLLEEGERLQDADDGRLDVAIEGLTSDSRAVVQGYLFAALPGTRADGSTFIADAVRRGAAAVLAPTGVDAAAITADAGGRAVPVLTDADPRRRLARIAARFYAGQPATVAAVTGTNGKTSVVWFVHQIWRALGRRAAGLGTLGLVRGAHLHPGNLTTPDPVALHRTLAELASDGVSHLAMEASSHGLDQRRLDGVRIASAGFTNLSRDHLDYHCSEAAYLAAKLRLFDTLVGADGSAVINADATHSAAVIRAAAARGLRLIRYGRSGEELRLTERTPAPGGGQRLVVAAAGRDEFVHLPLVGDFQAMNALCAAGLAWACGEDLGAVLAALAHLDPVPGRLERVACSRAGAPVYVDYAHTPDALAAVLATLRPWCEGRLWVVFGCGGDRDAGKRAEMGGVASALADRVVVTDDNPRSEDPAAIRAQVLAGCSDAKEIGDRGQAIVAAIEALQATDVLVIAGKGHETGQIVGDRVVPFDDRAFARAAAEG